MRKPIVNLLTAVAAVAVAACSSGGATSTGASSSQPATSSQTGTAASSAPILSTLQGAEQTRVAGLIAEARQEGTLNWLDSVPAPTTAKQMIAAFETAYGLPSVTINYTRSSTAAIGATLQQEVQSGKITTDIFGVGNPILFVQLKQIGALANYNTPAASAYAEFQSDFPDDPGYYMTTDAYSFSPVANLNLYKTPIDSWTNLLDPALGGGKLAVPDVPSFPSEEYWYIGLQTKLPASFFDQLAATHPGTAVGNSILEAANVAQGKVAVAIMPGFRASQAVKNSGTPLRVYYPKEGSVFFPQTYAIMAKSPHLALAELFYDYILSDAGQKLYVSLEGLTPTRSGFQMPADLVQYSPPLSSIPVIGLPWTTITQAQLTAAGQSWTGIFH